MGGAGGAGAGGGLSHWRVAPPDAARRSAAPRDPFGLLTQSENAFAKKKDDVTEIEKMAKTVTGILNKLAHHNFSKLAQQLIDLEMTSKAMLERVIDCVFDKALEDVFFQDMYAELCCRLGKNATKWCEKFIQVRAFSCSCWPVLSITPVMFRERQGEGGRERETRVRETERDTNCIMLE